MLFNSLLSSIDSLRLLGTILFWLSITSIFFGGAFQVARFYIDRRIKTLEVVQSMPVNQPIRTGTATIEVIAKSRKKTNSIISGRGGELQIGVDGESSSLIGFTTNECIERTVGKDSVLYKCSFTLDLKDKSIGKPVAHLKRSNLVQLKFTQLKINSTILGGSVVCTFNSNISFTIPVPEQKMDVDKILIHVTDFIQ